MDITSKNKMGTKPILPLIISMAVPSMFSMLIQSLYNVVDSAFVAQIGLDALTAVSLAFPVQLLIISVGVGTGVGVNSFISRSLGAKRKDNADSAATHAIVLGLLTWFVFILIGLFAVGPFIQMFTESETIADMGSTYLQIVSVVSVGVFVTVNIEKILQGTGNMMWPMIFQLTGAVINIVLDPILIFGLLGFPALGIAGAAIATVTAQLVSLCLSLFVIFRLNHSVKISFKGFKFDTTIVKRIYAVGFPSMIMQSVGSVMLVGLNAILISFSDAAVSVMGIYFKLQSFIFMPVFGLTQGLMPIMGFNYGAKNKDRLMKTLKTGSIIAFCIMCLGTVIFMIIPDKLLMIFNPTDEVLRVGVYALRAISTCFPFAAFGIVFSTLYQSVGQGHLSMYISLLRQLICILPMAFFLSFFGVEFVWYAFPFAELFAFITSIIFFKKLYSRRLHNLSPEN